MTGYNPGNALELAPGDVLATRMAETMVYLGYYAGPDPEGRNPAQEGYLYARYGLSGPLDRDRTCPEHEIIDALVLRNFSQTYYTKNPKKFERKLRSIDLASVWDEIQTVRGLTRVAGSKPHDPIRLPLELYEYQVFANPARGHTHGPEEVLSALQSRDMPATGGLMTFDVLNNHTVVGRTGPKQTRIVRTGEIRRVISETARDFPDYDFVLDETPSGDIARRVTYKYSGGKLANGPVAISHDYDARTVKKIAEWLEHKGYANLAERVRRGEFTEGY